MSICNYCWSLFTFSHEFQAFGCTDTIYNTYVVSKYIYQDKIFDGYPSFNSFQNFKELYESKTLKILEMGCTCDNIECGLEAQFSKKEHPKYYDECIPVIKIKNE